MNNIGYTTIDVIFSKFSRNLKQEDIDEDDIIEWVGEALGFMELSETLEESIAFIEVENHTAILPTGLKYVIQVVRNNDFKKDSITDQLTNLSLIQNPEGNPNLIHNEDGSTELDGVVITDSQGKILNTEYAIAYYRPYFDLRYKYDAWNSLRKSNRGLSVVRLSTNTLFNSIVCSEVDYNPTCCKDEYTITNIGTDKVIRTSFNSGQIVVPFLRQALDENGMPLIPDTSSHINAIFYYVKWQLAESYRWSGREGFAKEAEDSEQKWLKYIRQANNKAKMPKGVDGYQNLMEQSSYLIPKYNRYNSMFGGMNKMEKIKIRK